MYNKINVYKSVDKLKAYEVESLILESFKRSFTSSQINSKKSFQKKYSGIHVFLECTSDKTTNNLK